MDWNYSGGGPGLDFGEALADRTVERILDWTLEEALDWTLETTLGTGTALERTLWTGIALEEALDGNCCGGSPKDWKLLDEEHQDNES